MKRCLTIAALWLCVPICLIACVAAPRGPSRESVPQVTLPPLDPDNEANAMTYADVQETFGPLPRVRKTYRIGVVLKFFGNQYWQLLAEGVQSKADELGVVVDVRAAATETDPEGQRQVFEEMLALDYAAFIVSPQTDDNLIDVVAQAQRAGKIVLIVNEIVEDARYWVGPNQYESGVRAAEYLAAHLPAGSEVAVVEGLPGAYAARQRTRGFHDALRNASLRLVDSAPANWDAQQAARVAAGMLAAYPNLQGFYCNNDVMALGVIEAVNAVNRLDEVLIIGTDGIEPAYAAIRAGELTATVDSFPCITGQIALEVMVRLLEGQALPRVVYSPQSLIDAANIEQLTSYFRP